jgi:hypothetical protein
MTYLNGIDASFDILTPKKAQALRQGGYDVFVQCLWTGAEQPTTAVGNLRTAFDAGFPYVLGYISLAGGHLGAWHVEQGLGHLPPDVADRLHTVAIDIELPGIRNSAIREAVDAIEARYGLKIIYTSYNAWVSYQGNPQTFVDCLLWNAFWDGESDVDFPLHPFGGWRPDQVVAEQYTGGGDVFGLFADRNVWVKELLQKGDDMKIDEVRTELLGYIGNCLQAIAAQGAVVQELGRGLSEVAQTTYRLATLAGDSSTTQMGVLQEMRERVAAVEQRLEEERRRAVEAAKVIIGA